MDNENTVTPIAEAQAAAAPSLAQAVEDAAVKLGLSAHTAKQVRELLTRVAGEAVDEKLVGLLANAVTHDEDVSNADAAGYLRGRNDKIEALTASARPLDEPATEPLIPHYTRRSIWD